MTYPQGRSIPGRSTRFPTLGGVSRMVLGAGGRSKSTRRISRPKFTRGGVAAHPSRWQEDRGFVQAEVLHFELDLASPLPLVDGRVECQRADSVSVELAAPLGEAPGDHLHDHAPLGDAELEVVLAIADDPRFADDAHAVGHEQGPRIADAVRFEALDLLDDA